MPILIFNPKQRKLEPAVEKLVAKYKTVNKEMVVCVGGDGTILGAEARYPGVPKLPLRVSEVCRRCAKGEAGAVLEEVMAGRVRPKEYLKLEVSVNGRTLTALNEVNVRSADPRSALRFRVGQDSVIGDGVVVATPFGSTGYFENIARTTFELGMGVVYNNSNLGPRTRILEEDKVVEIEIIRGPGGVYVDNNLEWIEAEAGDVIRVTKAKRGALIFEGV